MTNLAGISVYNNNKELEEQMVKTALQSVGKLSCVFFTIDNCENKRFSSAAAAYNSVLDSIPDAEVLVFCHQDIIYLKHSLQDIYTLCMKEPLTLFGAAGVENTGHERGTEGRIISSMSLFKRGGISKHWKKARQRMCLLWMSA